MSLSSIHSRATLGSGLSTEKKERKKKLLGERSETNRRAEVESSSLRSFDLSCRPSRRREQGKDIEIMNANEGRRKRESTKARRKDEETTKISKDENERTENSLFYELTPTKLVPSRTSKSPSPNSPNHSSKIPPPSPPPPNISPPPPFSHPDDGDEVESK